MLNEPEEQVDVRSAKDLARWLKAHHTQEMPLKPVRRALSTLTLSVVAA